MIIRTTANLAKKIKVKPLPNIERADSHLMDWHCNYFLLHRYQTIILTNSVSLISLVFGGAGITNQATFTKAVIKHLVDYFRDWELDLQSEEFSQIKPEDIVIAKTDDRSVLGSITDLIWLAKNHRFTGRFYLGDLSFQLNQTPMGMLDIYLPFGRFLELVGDQYRSKTKIVSMKNWKNKRN